MLPITAFVGLTLSLPPSMVPPVIAALADEKDAAVEVATMLAAPDLAAPTGVGAANEVLAAAAAPEDDTWGTGAVVSETGTSTSPSLSHRETICQFMPETDEKRFSSNYSHEEHALEHVAVRVSAAGLRLVELTLGVA
jgi:hypothetical protein